MDTVTAIKKAISCRQFADHIGLRINRSGFAVCPFHGEKTASLKIYDGDNGWCCFGCHKGGDVINFASLYYGLGFKETLQRLNDDFNLRLMQESPETAKNRVLSAVEMARQKATRMKKERLKQAIEAEYWAVYDKWSDADNRVRENEPIDRDAEFSKDFVKAIIDRENLCQRLNELEMERINYDPK